ncbi:DUF4855 domain-containing protein, partial [Brevibacillus panacihumi]|uniref:DUF4855 domain-containing protein n=1 Tax=Brevibacillus panacihumi TaxID=497735 RepID=UPI003D21932A
KLFTLSFGLYVGLPAMDASTETAINNASAMYGAYKNYIDAMISAMRSVNKYFNFDLEGFYFTTETVHPAYKKISATNPTATSSVKLMQDLSNYIRNELELDFIWCPYYGFNENKENIIHNLGVIANRTNIFDCIMIQPAYYFWPDGCDERNITAVKKSVSHRDGILGEVVDLNGVPVAGGRSAIAEAHIGVVMEMNGSVNSGSYARRYQLYYDAFKDNRNKVDTIFYGGLLSLITGTSYMMQKVKDIYLK